MSKLIHCLSGPSLTPGNVDRGVSFANRVSRTIRRPFGAGTLLAAAVSILLVVMGAGPSVAQSPQYSQDSTQPPQMQLLPPPKVVNHADELTDWGIPPQADIKENIGSRTPMRIPGGTRITTQELPNIATRAILLDVLDSNGHDTLPGAIHLPGGGNYGRGRFNDNLQRNLASALARVTNKDPDVTLVFFCQGAQCWESYNAGLRAIAMGYRNVMWYRGGLASWKAAGLPVQSPHIVYRVRE